MEYLNYKTYVGREATTSFANLNNQEEIDGDLGNINKIKELQDEINTYTLDDNNILEVKGNNPIYHLRKQKWP